jgi:tRNA pseudouridine38-40 synthase
MPPDNPQQRKMVSLALLLTRSNANPTLLRNAYTSETRLHIPKAPALGLLLEEPLFETYNRKLSAANAAFEEQIASILGKAGTRQTSTSSSLADVLSAVDPPLDTRSTEKLNLARSALRPLLSFTPFETRIEEFKQKHIYADMRGKEERDGVFDKWSAGIDQGEIELAAGLRGMPVPETVKSVLDQRYSDPEREVSGTDPGWQNAGRGKMIKRRQSGTVDSDDEGLGFMDSKALRSAEMEG